jgi:OOP family OmpA-OmpF porin
VGVQAWAPTGQRSQWSSDGVFRARPRAMVSGEIGAFVWAAQLGFFARDRSEITGSAAGGVRIAKAVVVGPEIFASTVIDDAFAKRSTPVEALLGAHWLIDGTARIGLGAGGGLTDGDGAPSWRAIFGVEWAPEIPVVRPPRPSHPTDRGGPAEPDEDHDGVPDSLDACPRILGIKTEDPRTNGCPPDADDDGIDDVADACPTIRGLATSDPETNGCPDRDRDKDGVPNDVDACPDERGAPDLDPHRSGCPKAFARGSRIETLDPVDFKPGSAEIVASPDNEALLTAVLKVLLELPVGRRLRIEGHTDSRGDRRVGGARAAAVAKWLVEHGIDAARVSTQSAGPDRPIATNETEAGRAQNRRLEFHLEP